MEGGDAVSMSQLVAVIAWLGAGLASVLVGLLGWMLARVIRRLDDMTLFLQKDLRELMHQHDLRISSLETWRDAREGAALTRPKGERA